MPKRKMICNNVQDKDEYKKMFEVFPKLYVGTEHDCDIYKLKDWAIVHACKSPCHQSAIGYRGSLSKTHPNYLTYEVGKNLFLNMIDPPVPLFKPQLFISALDFIDKNIVDNNILIHCNLGLSRSPSIALLYLAKRRETISSTDYSEAYKDFIKIYPAYKPSKGILTYLIKNWKIF